MRVCINSMVKNISEYNFEKGDIGEKLVRRALRQKGYMLATFEPGQAHPCDNIVSKWDMQFRALDIKTYPRRSFFPDTGINYSHYEKYIKSLNVFYLIFVDEIEKKVYGNKLEELDKQVFVNGLQYPYFDGHGDKRKVYFPLQSMEFYSNLSDDFCNELRKISTSSYKKTKPKQFNINWQINESWN